MGNYTTCWDVTGDSLDVNSLHHQAIDQLAPVFMPVAQSEDAVLEGFQRRSTPVQAGYQFHPEKMRQDDPRFARVFELLVQDALAYRQRLARAS